MADILRDYRDYTMICAGVFDDMVATLVLENKEAILERNRQIVEENLALMDAWIAKNLRRHGLDLLVFPPLSSN